MSKPMIRELQPTYGPVGTVVTILGTDFGEKPGKVFFNSVEAEMNIADPDAKKKAAPAAKASKDDGKTEAEKVAGENKLVSDQIEAGKTQGKVPAATVPQPEKIQGGVMTGTIAGVPVASRAPELLNTGPRLPAGGGGTSAGEVYPAGATAPVGEQKDYQDVWGAKGVTVCVPEGATAGDVVVVHADGQTSNGSSFTVTAQLE